MIQLERDHNEEIGKLNMQMAAVLDDKDHQIKVHFTVSSPFENPISFSS